jgi:type I restriction enzyme S subunit
MSRLSFPTRKLKGSIRRITTRYDSCNESLSVYGVTNTEGLVITGKDSSEDTSKYIIVSGNQFAYNPYRVNIGSIGLAPMGFKGIVSPAYVVFETLDDIVPQFLYYYLKSMIGLNLIRWYGNRGGVRLSLMFEALEKIDFPNITKEQQLKALAIIKNFESKLDIILKEQNKQEILIQRLRQAILQEAVSGKLVPQDPNDEPASELLKKIKAEKAKFIQERKGKKEIEPIPISKEEIPFKLPQNWIWVRLSEICKLITDGDHATPPRTFTGKKILSAKNVRDGYLDYDNCDFISLDDYTKSRERCLPEIGDLLIVSVGATIGRTSLVLKDTDFALVRSVALIKPLMVNSFYVRYVLNSKLLQDLINSKKRGGAQPCLFLGPLSNLIFPLAPLFEQQRIVQKVDHLMKLCDELEEKVKENQNNSEFLMEAVLKEAFAS